MYVLPFRLGWTDERAHAALEYLMQEGLAWVDENDNSERSYWFPSLLDTKAN